MPEDEETTKRLLDEQDAFMRELKLKEREKDEVRSTTYMVITGKMFSKH